MLVAANSRAVALMANFIAWRDARQGICVGRRVVLRRVKRRGLASGAALFAARQGLAPDGIFRE